MGVLRWEGLKPSNKRLQERVWATQGNVLRSSLSLGNEALEKADEKIGRKVGRGALGVEWRGGLKSESTQALFKAMTTGLKTTGREKVKVQEGGGVEGRAPRPRKGPLAREAAAEAGGQLSWPQAPLAASGVGSSGLPPSPEHCSFAGRQGNCLLIAEVPDGAWGRGSAGQNGSVGRAARCGSPPPVASAARPGRQQKQLLPRP